MRLVLLLAVLAGCYRQAPPDPALLHRLDTLEARVAAQDKALTDARTQQPSSVELSVLAQRIEELTAQLADLQDKLAKAPAPAKRRVADPAAIYAFPLGTSPAFGPPTAKVTLVMVFEFACPYCRKAWDTVDALRKKYGKNLRVVYKQFVVHPAQANPAANAACAANHQGKWRAMAELLWAKAHETREYDQEHIDALALEAGLDIARYKADITGACPVEVGDDNELARKFAVSGTPTFFVNGRTFAGAKDQATFEVLIDEEMRKATIAIKAGVKPENFYAQEVLGKGLPEVPTP